MSGRPTHPQWADSIRAVLFDRDGVLTYFDTDAASQMVKPLVPLSIYELAERWQLLGAEIGFPSSIGEERLFFARFWEEVGVDLGIPPEQRAELKALDYAAFIRPFPEVPAVLRRLHNASYRLGVLSNFSLASLSESLQRAGIGQWIDVACAATVIGAAKPAPGAYQAALHELGIRPEQCLFFDDEEENVAGGRAMGIRSYLVDRGATGPNLEGVVHDLYALFSMLPG